MSGHLVTTPARRGHCPDCGAEVLTGIAEGLSVAADVEPLDLAAEIAVRLAGRMTYNAVRIDGATELVARSDPCRVRTRRWPVFAEHPHPAARHAVRDPGEVHPAVEYRRRKS